MKHCIYKLKRKSDHREYIGITNNLKRRINTHKRSSRFKNDDIENVTVLFEDDDRTFVEYMEPYFIQYFNTFKEGLNTTVSGKGNHKNSSNFNTVGFKYSEQSRQLMSEKAKQRAIREGTEARSKMVKLAWKNGGEALAQKQSLARKGKIATKKLSDIQYEEIRKLFNTYQSSPNVGQKARNGKILTKEVEFSKLVCEKYGVTSRTIWNIICNKCLR